MKKKVFVGISGGVDSSVSAALLKEAGYDVTGIFARVWHPDFLACTWKDDRRDAKRVCAALDIPFIEVNLENEYRTEVVEYMVREYAAGRTPNPDVFCNKAVKFGALYNYAMAQGADFVATGHYAQVADFVATGHYAQVADGQLQKAVDEQKDQTYFLWAVPQDRFKNTLFPIGHLPKDDVRKHAERFGLFTATKKDSQGLCFIGHVDMGEFLDAFIDSKPGNVLAADSAIIGTHNGALKYTIGQRHGFEIAKHGINDEPMYVISKNMEANTITVGPKDALHNTKRENDSITLSSCNWLSSTLEEHFEAQARIRHRGTLFPCTVTKTGDATASVAGLPPEETLASGQSLVLYQDNTCIGGGIIED